MIMKLFTPQEMRFYGTIGSIKLFSEVFFCYNVVKFNPRINLMSTSVEDMNKYNSEMMHNHNCFAYLLQLKPFVTPIIIQALPYLQIIATLQDVYKKDLAYGDLYRELITYLDNQIDSIYPQLSPQEIPAFDDFIHAIYHNKNGILEHTEWLVNAIGDIKSPKNSINVMIGEQLNTNSPSVNQTNPVKEEGVLTRLDNLFSSNFKPQYGTNIPSLKPYSYKQPSDPIEYRFSTQGQRHEDEVRVSPLFKHWLRIISKRSAPEQKISYIYFNNLGLDRSDYDIAGSKERDLTLELHNLEADPSLKVAVITLPASKGLMAHSDYEKTNDHLSYNDVFNEFLNVAYMHNHDAVNDLFISKEIQLQLFGKSKREILNNLLIKSFIAQGILPPTERDKPVWLSTAQKQAVWLHFIKYELTNYIIIKLQPIGYNFSCKDAIDRGAVSSAYYNLIKSFELNQPLNKKEFERALDSAAAIVKGRGMNFHRKIIWNALDAYVTAHHDELMTDPRKIWLVYWRDMNCPHSRVEQLLNMRIEQCTKQLRSLPQQSQAIKNAGLNVLRGVEQQINSEVSGQRLLLEIVSRTSELITNPSTASMTLYTKRAEELRINYGFLYVIGGLMKALLGVLLLLPSLGYSMPIIKSGLATASSGFFASDRNKLSDEMLKYSTLTPVA